MTPQSAKKAKYKSLESLPYGGCPKGCFFAFGTTVGRHGPRPTRMCIEGLPTRGPRPTECVPIEYPVGQGPRALPHIPSHPMAGLCPAFAGVRYPQSRCTKGVNPSLSTYKIRMKVFINHKKKGRFPIKQISKRVSAALLAVLMVLSLLPQTVLALDPDQRQAASWVSSAMAASQTAITMAM